MNANSARFHKTDEAIRDAFWTLMREKGFYLLRATDVIKTSGVNRSTFYEHYLDKYDLADRIENDLLQEFAAIMDGVLPALLDGNGLDEAESAAFSQKMVSWLSDNGEKFVLLMRPDGSPNFPKKLKQRVEAYWGRNHITTSDAVRDRYAVAAVLGLVTGLLNEWVSSGPEHSPEQFQTVFMDALALLFGYVGHQNRWACFDEAGGSAKGTAEDPHHPSGHALMTDSAFQNGTFFTERRGVYDYGK